MSWMTPVPGASAPALTPLLPAALSVAIDRSRQTGGRSRLFRHGERRVGTEQLLHPMPALLQPDERQSKNRDRVAHRVVRGVASNEHEKLALGAERADSAGCQLGREK